MMASLSTVNAVPTPGGFEIIQPNSLASAMMLALIDEDNVMIIDKSENNGVRGGASVLNNGKPVWGAIMSLSNGYAMRGLDMDTNPFCASGAVMGNGSWLVAGGNQGVGYGGNATGSTTAAGPYMDADGRLAIRLMNPQTTAANLQWIDQAASMTSPRWYPGIEVMTDGSVLLIGGATGGGYINRNTPNTDPAFQGGASSSVSNLNAGGANPTWEFFPQKGNTPTINNFMVLTSGLNMYPHTYLMPSGKLFMQANYSTTLWDMYANDESIAYTPLEDMPGGELIGAKGRLLYSVLTAPTFLSLFLCRNCPCLPCFWCHCYASLDSRKQLHTHYYLLRWYLPHRRSMGKLLLAQCRSLLGCSIDGLFFNYTRRCKRKLDQHIVCS